MPSDAQLSPRVHVWRKDEWLRVWGGCYLGSDDYAVDYDELEKANCTKCLVRIVVLGMKAEQILKDITNG